MKMMCQLQRFALRIARQSDETNGCDQSPSTSLGNESLMCVITFAHARSILSTHEVTMNVQVLELAF